MCCGTKDADHDYLTSICNSCFDTASKQRLPQSWNEPCRIHVMYCHAQPHLLFYGFVDLNNMSFTWSLVTTTLRRLWRTCTRNPPAARLWIFFAARPRPCFLIFFGLWSRALSEVGMFFLGRWSPQLNLSESTWSCWLFKHVVKPRGFSRNLIIIVNTTNKIVILCQIQ